MTSDKIKEEYLSFFELPPRNHKAIFPSPLVLENDLTTLFTSSGMQQLVPYLKGEKHPQGKRLVDCQPSIRAQGKNDDLMEVGDMRHLTYFDMLGNWSLGDYFKEEQINWIWEFFTEELKLPKKKLFISIFEGTKEVPKDDESVKVWKTLGVSDEKIFYYPAKNNWWSRSGEPSEMPVGEIGGPDSEVFYDFGQELRIHENSPFKKEKCHLNCDCGRFVEIGNNVFMEYQKNKDGTLSFLPQKNVDFGGGLERLTMAVNNLPDMFTIDIFESVIKAIEVETNVRYERSQGKERSFRVIADHLRASVMLIMGGVYPSNKMQGYILRKLLRRAIFHLHLLGAGISGGALVHIAEGFQKQNSGISKNWDNINQVISEEGIRFGNTLERGLRELTKIVQTGKKINGRLAFDLYQTNGFPLELTIEILQQNGIEFDNMARSQFKEEFEKHRELSRIASAGIFKGGLSDTSENVVKLHTATHLLHAALRKVLGEEVSQKGSNIIPERLRFDFSFGSKLTKDQIEKVEALVNAQIKKDLKVSFSEMTLDKAKDLGALHFFAEKYGKKVKVYTIGSVISSGHPFSLEVCAGPHITHTSQIGHVKIMKQEKIGANIIRLYATNK